MQVLFSRAVQARTSCRCLSCGQAAKAVARRTTTAAQKRRIGAGDIFTACYSTILASAAIADAEVKRERRKEWDRAIEEARARTTTHKAEEREQEAEQTTYSKISAQRSSRPEEGASPVVNWRPDYIFNRGNSTTVDVSLQGKLRSLDLRIKQSLDTSTETITKEDNALLDGSEGDADEWADENPMPGMPFREPKSRLQLEKIEETTTKLVMQLMSKISIFSKTCPSLKEPLSSETKAILEAIERLQTGFSKFPNYSWRNQRVVKDTRSALHTSLYKICQKTAPKQSEIDGMIAKICYNLLISTAPPSIITYNIMIGELSRLRLHEIADVVIDTYFCDTRFAPTLETTRLMLDHYGAKGDHKGFHAMLDRMRCTAPATREPGKPIGNMRIGARSIKLLYLPAIQRWAMQHKVIHRNGELVRKSPRDASVFDSIIRGCLEMGAVRKAVRYLKAALRERQDIRGEWIYAVAIACVEKLDYRGAHSLLSTLLSFWSDEEGNPLFQFSRDVRYGIFQLLGLCGINVTGATPSLRSFHYIRLPGSLHDLLLHLHIEYIQEKLNKSAEFILQLHSTLGLESHFGSGIDTIPEALTVLQHSSNYAQKGQIDLKTSQETCYRSHLKFIQDKLNSSSRRLRQNQLQLLSFTYSALSWASQEQYTDQIREPHPNSSGWGLKEKLDLLLRLTREERRPIFRREILPEIQNTPQCRVLNISAYNGTLDMEHWGGYRKEEMVLEA